MKHTRVIGTTEEAIARAEQELGRKFPPSFRAWLVGNNGVGIEGVSIFPVRDERDSRKTWDSIVRQYEVSRFGQRPELSHLLPFAEFGTGDYYCFDYSAMDASGELPVVRWSHETGETELRAEDFFAFVEKVTAGELDDD